MIEYSVILKRHKGSTRPNAVIYRDENRERAIAEMAKYSRANGFTVLDRDGRFTIADIVLVEKEPIFGAPVISETPYIEIFDECGRRRND